MGAGLVLGGLMLQAGHWTVVVKLLAILFFLLLTGPTSVHALSKAAWTHGIRPFGVPEEDGPSPS